MRPALSLTLRRYLTDVVPRAARRQDNLPDVRWRHLLVEIATRLALFQDDDGVRDALTPLPLVACQVKDTKTFLRASACYLDSKTVTEVLGEGVPIAHPVTGHLPSTTALYEWLGVASQPRLPDIVARIRQLTAAGPSPVTHRSLEAILLFLGAQMRDWRTPPHELTPLKDMAWLPARGSDTWHRPTQVHTVFSEHLFATQGTFLDLSRKLQQEATDFLHWLGVRTVPSVSQVVAHLLTCAQQQKPVNREVYTFLNRNNKDESIDQLKRASCLFLADGEYVAPSAVFRHDNPFGRFRWKLGPEFDNYGPLLERLGVKLTGDHEDARAVLIDIASEPQQRFHEPVEDEDDLAVIWRCWQMLDDALAQGTVEASWFTPLKDKPVVPDAGNVLTLPTRLLIDDMPGVANALTVGNSIIRRKEGMWRAFQVAGVRSLSDAVRVDVLQTGPVAQAGQIRERLDSYRPALARVLDDDPDGLQRLDRALDGLPVVQTPVLQVRYQLPEFRVPPADMAVKALYTPAEPDTNQHAQLIVCPQNGTWPWMPIAKELARALYPGEAPGQLASSLYVALKEPTIEAAHIALDDAGWPELEHIEVPAVDVQAVPGWGGGDTPTADLGHSQGEQTADATTNAADAAPAPDGMASIGIQHAATPAETPGSTGAGASVTFSSGREGPAGDAGTFPVLPRQKGTGTAPSTIREKPALNDTSHHSRRGRLRSYALPENSREAGAETTTARAAIDQAGIQRVVEHERADGRSPQVMAHNNPGYDIASTDSAGQVARHIEVKSTAGLWDDMGVGLTHTQFEFAQQHRETFWLYVVEHALNDDRARLLRIQDPAGRVEEFRFDDGWRAVSESVVTEP